MIHLGTDIVEVDRIKGLLEKYHERFLRHTYNQIEIDYCGNQLKPEIHYAGRFAAKEAVKKALYAAGLKSQLGFTAITVDRTPEGIPIVHVDGYTDGSLKVSISHTSNHAIATALYFDHD